MRRWDAAVIQAVGGREPNPSGYLDVFCTRSTQSRADGQTSLQRIFTTQAADRDEPTSWLTRQAQYDAVCTDSCSNTTRSLPPTWLHFSQMKGDDDETVVQPA
jgi:hypothetical protein